jgi:ferredoxin
MAFVIALPCIGVKDTACVTVCPADCIHPTKHEADFTTAEMLYVDPKHCIDCALCAQECPVNAVYQQDDLPAEWAEFAERNAGYFRDKDEG